MSDKGFISSVAEKLGKGVASEIKSFTKEAATQLISTNKEKIDALASQDDTMKKTRLKELRNQLHLQIVSQKIDSAQERPHLPSEKESQTISSLRFQENNPLKSIGLNLRRGTKELTKKAA